jgi:hypothetical protein
MLKRKSERIPAVRQSTLADWVSERLKVITRSASMATPVESSAGLKPVAVYQPAWAGEGIKKNVKRAGKSSAKGADVTGRVFLQGQGEHFTVCLLLSLSLSLFSCPDLYFYYI